ncbi:MAG: GldG family protein [Verrucomicrobiaceae bacterium]|nr:GldG family protein [Verrucomicrobiaceae bacterium]
MNNKYFNTLLIIAIIAVVNWIVGGLGLGNVRADLTEDGLYTLSQGTQNIIGNLSADKPVTIRFYASDEDRVMPPMLQNYARTVSDLLLEFEKAGDGKIILQKLAPNPDTEDEDKAREDDVRGMQINSEGDNLYLGMAIECVQQKEVLPFLNPQEETLLEYQVVRAVQKVSRSKKSKVGVMSAMPVMGSNDPMAQFQGRQNQPAWLFVDQLKLDYDVVEVDIGTDKVENDIDVLVCLHPASIQDKTLYALDQFVLRGGKLIGFVDPKCFIAEAISGQQQQNPMMRNQSSMIDTRSNLKKLLDAWGIGFDDDQVVADMSYRSNIMGRVNPTALSLPNEALNKDDRLTKDLQALFMMTPGAFSITKKDGIEVSPLIQSSEVASKISNADADKVRRENLTNFSPDGRNLALAVRLTGKFKTAFPEGKPIDNTPPAPKVPGESGGAQDDANAPAPAATPAPAPAAPAAPAAAATPAPAPPPIVPGGPAGTAPAAPVPAPATTITPSTTNSGDSLKESKSADGAVILFADADMLYHEFFMRRDPMIGMMVEQFNNLSLFLGAVEQMSGGGDLIAVRNRASTTRPFTEMDKKKNEVETQFRPQMQKLETELQDAVTKVSSLRGKRDEKTQRIILDPASQADLENWMKKQADIQKQIREIKKEQRKAIDWTEMTITLLNLVLVPGLVVLVGLLMAMGRRAATAAK